MGRQAAARAHGGLGAYAVRRILLLIPLVFGVTVVVFLLTSLVPGGPVAALLGGHATDTAAVEAIKARYHLNDSLFTQYVTWVGDVIHGNLGTSIYTSEPVATELQQRFGVTLALNAIAIVISLTIGVSLGMLAARSRGRFADQRSRGDRHLLRQLPELRPGDRPPVRLRHSLDDLPGRRPRQRGF